MLVECVANFSEGRDRDAIEALRSAAASVPGAAVLDVRYCATGTAVETEFNVVSVFAPGAPEAIPRLGVISSSCGLCGPEAIEDLVERIAPVAPAPSLSEDILLRAVDSIASYQPVFDRTGGLHAAAAFDPAGMILEVREDIGRHNAVDKVVGRMLLDDRLPATGLGLFVSGRASFEMVQKAWAAGFTSVVAVSAPSALAVEAAQSAGMQLAGFARNGTLNVYATNRQPDEPAAAAAAPGEPVL
jgi:FdhD protein